MINLTAEWRRTRKRPWRFPYGKALPRFREPEDTRNRGVVYLIVNTETRNVYVGCSSEYKKRVYSHRWALRNGCNKARKLQAEYDKYGADRFIFVPIERKVDINLLEAREQFWIWRMSGRLLNTSERA